MASDFDNPANWRLSSPGNGGVPIKYLGVEGSFEPETASVTFRCLVPSSRLVEFVIETFPPPLVVGRVIIPQPTTLPGLPGLVAKKIGFKNPDDGRPVDPFGWDPSAASGTYHPVLEITIEYGPRAYQQPTQGDPKTFLEVSSNTTGEFIHSTAPKAKWQLETPDPRNKPNNEDPGEETDPETNTETRDPAPHPPVAGATETVKDPQVPLNILVPQTEWTVTWPQVPYYYYYNILIRRLRWCLGRVNSEEIPLLMGALPETILFAGFNAKSSYTWRDGAIGTPPVNVEMKFVEKRVDWNERIIGHNHFWRPGKGWERLLIDGVNPTFQSRDMNVIWEDV